MIFLSKGYIDASLFTALNCQKRYPRHTRFPAAVRRSMDVECVCHTKQGCPYFFLGFGLLFGFGFFFGIVIPFIRVYLLSYFVFLSVRLGTETCRLYGVTLISIISPPPPCSSTLLLVV